MGRPALVVPAISLILLAGCATQQAPPYAPSVENAHALRDSGAGVAKVGKFRADPKTGNNDYISLRGLPLTSPVGGKYTDYIEEALRSELRAARLLDDKAAVEITGFLMKNDVDISGAKEGWAEIEARVIVRRGGQVRFNKVKYAKTTFESSFAGAVAMPRGAQSYPEVVRKFMSVLFSDQDFISALK